jgi:hypothetical protein
MGMGNRGNGGIVGMGRCFFKEGRDILGRVFYLLLFLFFGNF